MQNTIDIEINDALFGINSALLVSYLWFYKQNDSLKLKIPKEIITLFDNLKT